MCECSDKFRLKQWKIFIKQKMAERKKTNRNKNLSLKNCKRKVKPDKGISLQPPVTEESFIISEIDTSNIYNLNLGTSHESSLNSSRQTFCLECGDSFKSIEAFKASHFSSLPHHFCYVSLSLQSRPFILTGFVIF